MLLLRSTNLIKTIKISTIATYLNKANKIQSLQIHNVVATPSLGSKEKSCINHSISYSFTTQSPEKTSLYMIKMACEELITIDSLLLDDLCIAFGKTYILSEKLKDDPKAKQN
jgi:hypothetical protein